MRSDLCPCGRLSRGLGWQDPVTRGIRIPACSMRHLDYIHDRQGDMTDLNDREQQAVVDAIEPMMADIRAFDFTNAPDHEIYEFLAYCYQSICDKAIPY